MSRPISPRCAASAYRARHRAPNRHREALLAALDAQRLDALLCPPYPLPAVPHGATVRLGPVHGHTLLFNLVGMPAGVVAWTRVRPGEESGRPPSRDRADQAARAAEQGSAGLPIGVQVAARLWREDVVLAVLGALEAGNPARVPPRT
ncbi:amidase family protein [Sorangium sp. So ce887]|uniref:amidase family protein n=1 Tax=Sorangium sp. So ce887 TaxID=3133324 RepID=UPI003F63F04C